MALLLNTSRLIEYEQELERMMPSLSRLFPGKV